MTGRILGTGACVPSYIMDNNEIAEMVETSDAWIRERTGVVRRHIIHEETTVSMACEAAKRALTDGAVKAEEIDLILVSTVSSNVIAPCTACEVQRELGAVYASCFDLNGACSGFVLAYNTALAYLCGGIYRTVLVIGSESLSNLVDWKDRGTCILFGDGAGAVVLRAEAGDAYLPVTHSDGVKGVALVCQSRLTASSEKCWDHADYYLKMDGQAVFKFAVKKVPEAVEEVLEKNHLRKEDISWYLLHQANQRIIEAAARRLREPMEKFPINIQEYGNTSSASIGILLDEMKRDGRLQSGQKIVIAGFGAGLTWAASVLQWP